MAITATAPDTNSSTANQTGPYTTANITPTANQPVLLWVFTSVGSGTTPTPSVSGCGLTWRLVDNTAVGSRTMWLFLGRGSSPTTGALSIAGDGSTTVTSCLWQVVQCSGVNTAVNDGVVQSVNAKPNSTTSASVPFGSTVTAGNATFGAVGITVQQAPSAGAGWTSLGTTAQSGPSSGFIGEFAATGQQNITASWTTAANAFVVGVELAAAATGGTSTTISVPTAKGTATAPTPTVSTSGGTVTIPVPTATATGSSPVPSVLTFSPAPTPSAQVLTWPVPDSFKQSMRSGYALSYTVDASYGGTPVAGATGMSPVGGTITDTTKPGARRVLNLDLAPSPGLFDLLSPIGTTLTVTAHVTYTSRAVVNVPMGVFDIDSQTMSEGGGKLSLTAPDKWVRIKRARFAVLGVSTPGMRVVDQIALMIRDALGQNEPVNITATSQAVMGAQTWDKDRDAAIIELATGIGAWVFFDRNGVATIADVPSPTASSVWLIDSSASGVLVSLDRSRSRTSTYNVVVVSSSAASGEAFPAQFVADSDPTSPTYAGSNPPWSVNAAPFGISTYYYDTPLPLTVSGAQNAGRTILARTTGLSAQVSLGSSPNPAIDAFDAISVVPPAARAAMTIPGATTYPGSGTFPGPGTYPGSGAPVFIPGSGGQPMEQHIVDTVTHQLDVSSNQPQQIDGRSTRSDPYQ